MSSPIELFTPDTLQFMILSLNLPTSTGSRLVTGLNHCETIPA